MTSAGEVLCPGIDAKGEIEDAAGAPGWRRSRSAVDSAENAQRERRVQMTGEVKTCINCGRPLADRVEEEERTGTAGSRSTGECSTYRVWFCANSDCVMYQAPTCTASRWPIAPTAECRAPATGGRGG